MAAIMVPSPTRVVSGGGLSAALLPGQAADALGRRHVCLGRSAPVLRSLPKSS